MKPSRLIAAAALGLLASQMPGPRAIAQGQASLQQILSDPGEQAHVLDAARRSSVVINNACPSAHFELTDVVVIYTAPTLNAAGAASGGAWKQVVREDGCGVSRTLNVLASVPAPGTLETTPLLPGTTHADPLLQKDAARHAGIAAGLSDKNCRAGYIADTEYLQPDGTAQAGSKGRPWRELWTLVSCSRKLQVPMRFIPDSTGTQVAAEPARLIPADSK